jgi:hypothetical protein
MALGEHSVVESHGTLTESSRQGGKVVGMRTVGAMGTVILEPLTGMGLAANALVATVMDARKMSTNAAIGTAAALSAAVGYLRTLMAAREHAVTGSAVAGRDPVAGMLESAPVGVRDRGTKSAACVDAPAPVIALLVVSRADRPLTESTLHKLPP